MCHGKNTARDDKSKINFSSAFYTFALNAIKK